jgi:hypothetical protein
MYFIHGFHGRAATRRDAKCWKGFFLFHLKSKIKVLSNLGEAIERDNNEFAIEEFGRGATVLRNRLSLSNAKTADVTVWYTIILARLIFCAIR